MHFLLHLILDYNFLTIIFYYLLLCLASVISFKTKVFIFFNFFLKKAKVFLLLIDMYTDDEKIAK